MLLLLLALTSPAEAIFANRDFFWKAKGSHPVMIPVCWENPGAVPAERLGWVRQALESSWQRHARVNFTQWDTCSPGDPGVHIQVSDERPHAPGGVTMNGATGGATLNLSFDVFGPPGCRANDTARKHCVHSVAIHEFGHVLGFYHEEERPDYVPPNATSDCATQHADNSKPQYYGAYDIDSVMSYCGQPGGQPETWKDDLSPDDIAAAQRVYGRRIPGSAVSPGGRCLASHKKAPSGEPAFLWVCDEAGDDQEWRWGAFDHLSLGAKRCLATMSSAASPAEIEDCNIAKPLQTWALTDVQIRGWGSLCLDLQGGDTTNGTPVQMWTCGALRGLNQRWTIDLSTSEILYGSSGKCLTLPPTGQAYLYDCTLPDMQRFKVMTGGRIKLKKGKCLDVQGWTDAQYRAGQGLPFDGEAVQQFKCIPAQLNQRWHMSGKIHQKSTGLCLDRVGNADADGTGVQTYSCNDTGAQEWDYYIRR
jgi:hypothetical protein